ncbi:MAG: SDR family NAD(P)-dependent oxidoreductase [Flavobacteriaceae bacterium]|nr:SDR family NAD(P)-dependent oxidoreductase [Flavobacteriaceae bacterium]
MPKTLIITGGSRGLGLGIAKRFHKKGFRVFSIARTQLKKCYEIEQISCDISDPIALKNAFDSIFKTINEQATESIVLINNAGMLGEVDTMGNISLESIQQTIHVNLTAPMQTSALFIKQTEDWKCRKNIINISSGAAANAYGSWSMYCASKAGLDMMAKVISKEQKKREFPIKIANIYPGVVDTDMQKEVRAVAPEKFKSSQRFIEFHLKGKLLLPDDVAKIIYKLYKKKKLNGGKVFDVRKV